MPSDGKSSHCLWQGELKMFNHTNIIFNGRELCWYVCIFYILPYKLKKKTQQKGAAMVVIEWICN
jgi:hypothetical protein